jgi:hypothetical protein
MARVIPAAAGSEAKGLRSEMITRFGARIKSGQARRGDQRTYDRLKAGVSVQLRRTDLPAAYRPETSDTLFELRGDRLVAVPPWSGHGPVPAQWTVEFEQQPNCGTDAALTAGKPVTVPTWMALPGNIFPGYRNTLPWLADRSVTHVRITADDRISPGDPADQLARR